MLSNELLEDYAETFLALDIQMLADITFKQFLTQPEFYTKRAQLLIHDGALNIHNEMTVELT